MTKGRALRHGSQGGGVRAHWPHRVPVHGPRRKPVKLLWNHEVTAMESEEGGLGHAALRGLHPNGALLAKEPGNSRSLFLPAYEAAVRFFLSLFVSVYEATCKQRCQRDQHSDVNGCGRS